LYEAKWDGGSNLRVEENIELVREELKKLLDESLIVISRHWHGRDDELLTPEHAARLLDEPENWQLPTEQQWRFPENEEVEQWICFTATEAGHQEWIGNLR
jgi:hypothetical protein